MGKWNERSVKGKGKKGKRRKKKRDMKDEKKRI